MATTCDTAVRLSASFSYTGRSWARTSALGWVYLTAMRDSLMASSYPSCGVAVMRLGSQASMVFSVRFR